MRRWIFDQRSLFYGTLAGALMGSAIGLLAQALEQVSDTPQWWITALRLSAACVIIIASGLFIKIGQQLENIDRWFEVGQHKLMEEEESKSKSKQTIMEELQGYKEDLEEQYGDRVVPNFRAAVVWIVIALLLLFAAGQPLDKLFTCTLVLFGL